MNIKLYCLPYAGASANIYMRWKRYLHNSIEIRPIEMAGRGKRQNEPFYESIDEAVDEVFNTFKEEIKDGPYSIFGHSMGSIIAYELAWKLQQLNCNPPVHIFFSGRKAPHIRDYRISDTYKLPDNEFENEILKLGGTSAEVFEHEELKNIFTPILRADYKICDTYENIQKGKLNYNFSVFYGNDDEMTLDEVSQWRDHTTKECKIYEFEGGHFFINDYTEDIVNIINDTLISKIENRNSCLSYF